MAFESVTFLLKELPYRMECFYLRGNFTATHSTAPDTIEDIHMER